MVELDDDEVDDDVDDDDEIGAVFRPQPDDDVADDVDVVDDEGDIKFCCFDCFDFFCLPPLTFNS